MIGAPSLTRRIPPWLRRGLLVGVTNMRRQFRKTRQHRWIAVFQVFAVVFGVLVAVGRLPVEGYAAVWPTPGGYVLGERLATDRAAVASVLRGFAGVAFALLVFLTVLKETTDGAMDAHVDSLVLAAGVESVAVGNVVWNLLLTGWQFGLVVVAGAVAFGVGAGSPAVVATLSLAGLALLVTAVPVGYAVALVANAVFDRVPTVRRHKVLFGAPLAVGYFLLFARARAAMSVLGSLPTGWYADLGLTTTGVGIPARGVAVLAAAPLVLFGATILAVRLGALVWYGDAIHPGDREEIGDQTGQGGRTLDATVGRPAAAVTRTVWKRLRREPRTLLFAALPVALAGSVGIELVGRRPATLPAVLAVYGASAVGMGATLNPLGSLGSGMPAVLTAPDGGRHLVQGYVLSAALPGVPIVAGLAGTSALGAGFGPAVAVAAAVQGAVLAGAAPFVSLVVGLALPNLEGIRPTGTGIRPPRLAATTAFLAAVAAMGIPGLMGVGLTGPLAAATGAGRTAVLVGGVLATGLVAGTAAALSYRRAVATVGTYQVE